MAITDMVTDTAKERLRTLSVIILAVSFSSLGVAGELSLRPKVSVEELFSDNVELSKSNKESSLVTLLSPGIEFDFLSRKVELNLDFTYTEVLYSHDSDLNDSFAEAEFASRFLLYPDGLAFVANASINNISSNNARNALADIVSGGTTESKKFSYGFEYLVQSNTFNINSHLLFSETRTGDNLGERKGYDAILNTSNGNNARTVFWDVLTKYAEYDNNQREGEYYTIDATVGYISDFKLNPFLRYYSEETSGNVNDQNIQNTTSLGAGIRWQVNRHLDIDVAYNAVDKDDNSDAEDTDDYVSGKIAWQPSPRTNLSARYYNRFNNDAYQFSFSHRLRRLSTKISYTEEIDLLDRFELEEQVIQEIWCLTSNPQELGSCLISPDSSIDLSQYTLVNTLTELIPVESNSFSLNKTLNATFNYRARRTNYQFSINNIKRENLELDDYDTYENITLLATRDVSRMNKLSASFKYNKNTFDQSNQLTDERTDTYRIYSVDFKQQLLSNISITYLLQHLNRSSTNVQEYRENRASIKIEKEF